ncbi:(d)CMP kinase [Aerococcaceae bacterium NML201209]|nr:(d)CMP kinase [Aerococcaceae bacterium NML201209]MCW6674443.1 (d)CMP kinase [Aerococcaceae bacterium NML171108]MCW6677054.1 (d)CMP kinase [Aerococcaceae bacterium NML180378]MCW6681017.1 (d)CMP kinase [Aerococcaceae bacterium NML130460]
MCLTIAIDGPASSGKSTIAKRLAERLGITYLDTGAMYRAVTLYFMTHEVDVADAQQVCDALEQINLSFEWIDGLQHIFLNGEDVSETIRTTAVTHFVSEVSAIESVRKLLVEKQQAMAQMGDVIMDGRDIGTVVLPQAKYKFFFTATPEVRAQRRFADNQARGIQDETLDEIREAIIARDLYDSTRTHSPLKKASDAIEIDTSHLTVDEVAELLFKRIQEQSAVSGE